MTAKGSVSTIMLYCWQTMH